MSPVLHVAVHSKLGRAETACALQAALALSLPLKQHEARLKHLSFWQDHRAQRQGTPRSQTLR